MKNFIVPFFVIALMSTSQYVYSGNVAIKVSLKTIIKDANYYSGKIVSVGGYMKYNIAQVPYLFPNKKEADLGYFNNGFDLGVPFDIYKPDERMIESGHCVSITAKFVHYVDGTIRLDYIASPTGKLIVHKIKFVNCPI